jgi:molybdenum cofactor synthesis domain-containing protein
MIEKALVPDETEAIQRALRSWTRQNNPPDLILTTGGTGLAPRDITPEATAPLLDKRHPGLLELARLRCYQKTPMTYLSRGEAGTVSRTLVINLPGSKRGSGEMLEALLDVLPHAIETLRGEATDCRPPAPGTSSPTHTSSKNASSPPHAKNPTPLPGTDAPNEDAER